MTRRDDDGDDWVEKLTKLASHLGFNPMRTRWRLMGLRKSLQQGRWRVDRKVDHVKYEHKTCPFCGRVADKYAVTCAGCGESLSSRSWQVVERVGLAMPSLFSVSSLLGAAMLVVYARIMVANPGEGYLSMPGAALVRHGANWPPATFDHQWWRFGTYIFLHIGLLHLGFNLLALAQIGPAIEKLFGRSRMLVFFMLTGILAGVGSAMLGPKGISAGASGAIMGLIGVGAGWGQRDGTTIGRELRNRMVMWGAYTIGIGFMVHADNAAHGAGFIVGALLGFLSPPSWRQRQPSIRPLSALNGFIAAVAALACLALTLIPPKAQQRWADLMTPAGRLAVYYGVLHDACDLLDRGDRDAAAARLESLANKGLVTQEAGDLGGKLDGTCVYYASLRRSCGSSSGAPPPDPEDESSVDEEDAATSEQMQQQTCDAVKKAESGEANPW